MDVEVIVIPRDLKEGQTDIKSTKPTENKIQITK